MKAFGSQRVVVGPRCISAIVVIENGIIKEVFEGFAAGEREKFERKYPGVEIEDFGDKVLMPGLVDSHVHCNEPGRTDWEGFWTATQAAAAGGITTIIDMPL